MNEHRINLYEISHLTEEQLELFESDFGAVAEYFVRSKDDPEYVPRPRPIRHVDEFLKMMSVFTGDSRYGEMVGNFEEKEEITMCDVLDCREKIGEQRGIAMGVLKGEARMSELVSCLLADGRLEDLKRSTGDVSFREQLLKEYCLA